MACGTVFANDLVLLCLEGFRSQECFYKGPNLVLLDVGIAELFSDFSFLFTYFDEKISFIQMLK
jgi:hypothetical protein